MHSTRRQELRPEGTQVLKATLDAGEEVERPSRAVTVLSFELQRSSASSQDLDFYVSCSKGTYIRALGHDLVRTLPNAFQQIHSPYMVSACVTSSIEWDLVARLYSALVFALLSQI